MRNIGDVIDQMLAVIPTKENSFRTELTGIMDSIRYSAPESINLWWNELTLVINGYIPHDLNTCEPWERRVAMILMDKQEI